MKLIRKTDSVKSSDDFELSIPRTKDVDFFYSYPESKKLLGIVFIIPGFGDDTNSEYGQKLRDYIAETFSVVAVHVIYHCFYSRKEIGAEYAFDDFDKEIAQKNIAQYNLMCSSDSSIDNILRELSIKVAQKKENQELQAETRVMQTMTIIPKYDEYQNFGVLQAIDHINVLQKLRKENLNFTENYPTVLMGSSHGGYIANLIAKFSPKSVDCVIDNSAYIEPKLNYIIGKEVDFSKSEFSILFGANIILNCFVRTLWENNKDSYYYFSKDRYEIRRLIDNSHVKQMKSQTNHKIKYIFYHYQEDKIAPIEEKMAYMKELSEEGYEVSMEIIRDQLQVDGKFIKSLDHGLGMSMKELANKTLPEVLQIKSDSSKQETAEVSYTCETLSYDFKNINGIFTAIQMPLENLETTIIQRYTQNLDYFKKNYSHVYEKLVSFDSALDQGLYENKYDLVYQNNYFDVKELSTGNFLYNSDSKKHAYELSQNFHEHLNSFIFFGVALGEHIVSIDKQIQAQNYLIVEDDLELFKLSLFTTSYYELGLKASLHFSVFESDEEFMQNSHKCFNDSAYYAMPYQTKNKITLLKSRC